MRAKSITLLPVLPALFGLRDGLIFASALSEKKSFILIVDLLLYGTHRRSDSLLLIGRRYRTLIPRQSAHNRRLPALPVAGVVVPIGSNHQFGRRQTIVVASCSSIQCISSANIC
jgi:hypothetical protein